MVELECGESIGYGGVDLNVWGVFSAFGALLFVVGFVHENKIDPFFFRDDDSQIDPARQAAGDYLEGIEADPSKFRWIWMLTFMKCWEATEPFKFQSSSVKNRFKSEIRNLSSVWDHFLNYNFAIVHIYTLTEFLLQPITNKSARICLFIN